MFVRLVNSEIMSNSILGQTQTKQSVYHQPNKWITILKLNMVCMT